MKEKIINWIYSWEKKGYENGIPMLADENLEANGLVPSYRRICKAILKNDIALVSLGFSRPYSEIYNSIKREEILKRKV